MRWSDPAGLGNRSYMRPQSGKHARFGAAIALAAMMLAGPALAAAPDAGEVLTLKGDCFAEAGGAKTALKQGDAVHVGDVVEVPDVSRLKLRMIDGSVLSAASGTTLTIQSYATGDAGRDVKLDLANGLVRAVVSKIAQPSHYEIDTATGVAAVRSTDWFIRTTPTMTQVGVLGGLVRLTSTATQHEVDIPARWGAKVEVGKDPVPPRVWKEAEFQDVIDRTNLD